MTDHDDNANQGTLKLSVEQSLYGSASEGVCNNGLSVRPDYFASDSTATARQHDGRTSRCTCMRRQSSDGAVQIGKKAAAGHRYTFASIASVAKKITMTDSLVSTRSDGRVGCADAEGNVSIRYIDLDMYDAVVDMP